MGVKLVSSGGGSVEINPPATASNFVATMPAGTGNVVVAGINSAIVSGTAVTASGTAVDFTGIPSWVKRITVTVQSVSTNGTSNYMLQIGAGSVITTGYVGALTLATSTWAGNISSATTGFQFYNTGAASDGSTGHIVLTLISGNTWVYSSNVISSGLRSSLGTGYYALSGSLDRVRITTVNGTDTFDAGTINILYE
jgi:hypothetical protein